MRRDHSTAIRVRCPYILSRDPYLSFVVPGIACDGTCAITSLPPLTDNASLRPKVRRAIYYAVAFNQPRSPPDLLHLYAPPRPVLIQKVIDDVVAALRHTLGDNVE